jgi:hypothetical protein
LYESYSDNDIMAQEADELKKLLPLLEQTRRKKDQEQAKQEKTLLVEGEMLEGKHKVTVGALPNMETLKGELKTKLSLTKAIDLLEVWDEESEDWIESTKIFEIAKKRSCGYPGLRRQRRRPSLRPRRRRRRLKRTPKIS